MGYGNYMTTTTNPTETSFSTTKIENFQPGHRYVECFAGFEANWTVATVQTWTEDRYAVLRDGAWVEPVMVTVTYQSGKTIEHELGTLIAHTCDIVD